MLLIGLLSAAPWLICEVSNLISFTFFFVLLFVVKALLNVLNILNIKALLSLFIINIDKCFRIMVQQSRKHAFH